MNRDEKNDYWCEIKSGLWTIVKPFIINYKLCLDNIPVEDRDFIKIAYLKWEELGNKIDKYESEYYGEM